MWPSLITNKKMIESMFPEGLDLNLPEPTNISIASNDIKISFNLRDIPKVYPKKWDDEYFNAIHLVLEFGDVVEFLSSGSGFDWLNTLELKSDNGHILIEMAVGSFKLKLASNFLTVRSVQPYDDTRWE